MILLELERLPPDEMPLGRFGDMLRGSMLPRSIVPMRLVRLPEPFDSSEFVYEPKIDGFCALATFVGIGAGSCHGADTRLSSGRPRRRNWRTPLDQAAPKTIDGTVNLLAAAQREPLASVATRQRK